MAGFAGQKSIITVENSILLVFPDCVTGMACSQKRPEVKMETTPQTTMAQPTSWHVGKARKDTATPKCIVELDMFNRS